MTTASAARNRRPFSAVNVSDLRTTVPPRKLEPAERGYDRRRISLKTTVAMIAEAGGGNAGKIASPGGRH
jgi:hypothetical protein